MSLFRTERLSIALCPEQVAVLRSPRGKRAVPSEPLLLAVLPEADAPLWKGAVAALADGLQALPTRRASATLVLSNRFARFALLPWAAAAQGEAEAHALAAACFESLYGDMTGWVFSFDDGAYGSPKLACAIEASFLEGLKGAFDARGVSCPRVEPYFVTCWNRWRNAVKAGDALFAVTESGATVIATLQAGQWHSVRTQSGSPDWTGLSGMMSRESLLQGFAEPPAGWLHAPALDSSSCPAALIEARDKLTLLLPDVQTSISVNAGPAQVMAAVGAGA